MVGERIIEMARLLPTKSSSTGTGMYRLSAVCDCAWTPLLVWARWVQLPENGCEKDQIAVWSLAGKVGLVMGRRGSVGMNATTATATVATTFACFSTCSGTSRVMMPDLVAQMTEAYCFYGHWHC